MLNSALLSSRSQEWSTPKELFDQLNGIFRFTLDPCATCENAKCKNYFTKAEDGMRQPWIGRVFMNPPYGRQVGKWVRKAFDEAQQNAELVLCLLPARTDTRWWHQYCMRGEIVFIKGRLKFGEARNSAPFPSALVLFRRLFDGVVSGKPVAFAIDNVARFELDARRVLDEFGVTSIPLLSQTKQIHHNNRSHNVRQRGLWAQS